MDETIDEDGMDVARLSRDLFSSSSSKLAHFFRTASQGPAIVCLDARSRAKDVVLRASRVGLVSRLCDDGESSGEPAFRPSLHPLELSKVSTWGTGNVPEFP